MWTDVECVFYPSNMKNVRYLHNSGIPMVLKLLYRLWQMLLLKKISFFKSTFSEVPSVQIYFLYENAISHWSQVVNEQLKGTDAARLN